MASAIGVGVYIGVEVGIDGIEGMVLVLGRRVCEVVEVVVLSWVLVEVEEVVLSSFFVVLSLVDVGAASVVLQSLSVIVDQ